MGKTAPTTRINAPQPPFGIESVAGSVTFPRTTLPAILGNLLIPDNLRVTHTVSRFYEIPPIRNWNIPKSFPARYTIGGGGVPNVGTHAPLRPILLLLLLTVLSAHASTLDHIRQTHILRCGINQETPEYSSTDDHGARQSFDADFCRAVAIAILGPNARTILTSYPDDVAAMAALRSNKVDLLPTLTLDLTHASNPTLTFSPPILYDGVGFLVPNSANIKQAAELTGEKICFLAATQVEPSLQSWFATQHLNFVPFPFNEEGEMEAAFVTGNCTALAGDLTRLVNIRLGFGPLATHYTLLSNASSLVPSAPAIWHDALIISQDPLAAASLSNDPAFARIITWTLEVLLNAEAADVTQSTATNLLSPRTPSHSSSHADRRLPSRALQSSSLSAPLLSSRSAAEGSASSNPDPTLAILAGDTAEIGSRLNLRNTWALEVIAAVGNYGEIYDRTLGNRSPLKLPRTQNHLTTQGGLMLPLPLK
jgi:general L-amino acid transport system substrate-binding protein